MKPVEVSIHIDAPAQHVFSIAADIPGAANTIKAITSIEMLTPGPVGLGTRWKETRMMFGKSASETMEVTAFDPPRSYTVEARSHGAHYLSLITVTPSAAGCDMRMTFTATPITRTAKLFSFMNFFMAGMIRKCFEADLKDIKAAAESPADTPR